MIFILRFVEAHETVVAASVVAVYVVVGGDKDDDDDDDDWCIMVWIHVRDVVGSQRVAFVSLSIT
jgi:hypothetical protein